VSENTGHVGDGMRFQFPSRATSRASNFSRVRAPVPLAIALNVLLSATCASPISASELNVVDVRPVAGHSTGDA